MTSIIPKKTFEKNYDTFTSFIFVWSLAATNISSHKCFNFSRDIITTIVAITINMMAAIKKWDNRHQNSGHHDDSRHHHYYGKHHLSSPRLLAITIVDIITMMVMRLRHLAFRRSDPDRDATSSVLQLLCYNIHHHHHIFLSSSPPLSSSFFLTVIFFLKKSSLSGRNVLIFTVALLQYSSSSSTSSSLPPLSSSSSSSYIFFFRSSLSMSSSNT